MDEARPGYAEIKAARDLHPDSGAWAFFMREIIRLPREMTPAVSQVIRLERWKFSPDPLEAVRTDARAGTQLRVGQTGSCLIDEGGSTQKIAR